MRLRRDRQTPVGLWSGLCIAVAMLACVQAAEAASCASLKAELSSLTTRSGGTSPAAQKWKTALRQQDKALAAAERDANYFGCGRTSSSQCKSLNSKIKKMRRNKAAIERQVAKSGGSANRNTKRIRQVRAAIANQKCGAPAKQKSVKARSSASQNKPRSLLARLFNPQTGAQTVAAKPGDQQIKVKKRSSATGRKKLRIPSVGTFRTLCVRTCDGYFFPVSFSTGKSQFSNDEARCSEICPASETELYVYKNPGGDQADMMSLAGDLYSDQSFAYRYKKEFVQGCSCRLAGQTKNPSSWTEISGSAGGKSRVLFTDISSGLPRRSLQPSRGQTQSASSDVMSPLARTPLPANHLPDYQDPDTLTNLEKGFNSAASLKKVKQRLGLGSTKGIAKAEGALLPRLGFRLEEAEDSLETASVPPVFKVDQSGFKSAPDSQAPVRVVGPEYFVAQ